MTFVPVNPRSELVTPAKCSGAGVCDTFCRFQIASPASCSPAFNPTRGSGDGAMTSGAEMSGLGSALATGDIDVVDVPAAQPAMTIDAITDPAAGSARVMTFMFYLLVLGEAHPASAACDRSRCFDRLARRWRT